MAWRMTGRQLRRERGRPSTELILEVKYLSIKNTGDGNGEKEDIQNSSWRYIEREVAQSCLTLCDPMDCRLQSMGFSRLEYWSGLPFPSPGDIPHPRIETGSPAL